MAKFRKTTSGTVAVDLRALAAWIERDATLIQRKQIAPIVNNICDSLLGEDAFGTEGQNDPRGDHRG